MEIRTADGQIVDCAPRQRAILAYLALHANEDMNAERMLHEIWSGSPPASGKGTLRFHVHKLRNALGTVDAAQLDTTPSGYRLSLAPDELDISRFERLARTAMDDAGKDPRIARSTCRKALALWRGDALEDFRFDEFAQPSIQRLDELRLSTLETRLEADLAAGLHRDISPELETLGREFPLRERIQATTMRALYRSGRTADALRVFAAAADALAEVGLEPGEALRDLEEQILLDTGEAADERAIRAATTTNVPTPPTRLIGRNQDVEDAIASLERSRFVTLRGTGGSGKTRLAIAVAHAWVDRFSADAFWVDLSATSGNAVRSAIAASINSDRSIGANPWESALERLRESPSALVAIDNCEHVADQVAACADEVVQRAPRAVVLATSRRPLDSPLEVTQSVAPFATPLPAHDLTEIQANSGVRLFTERARSVRAVTEDDDWLRAVAQICQELEGLPLALELAAAKTRSLSLAEILRRLDDEASSVLSRSGSVADRHSSITNTIAWSHELLSEDGREVFTALGAFRGTYTLHAVSEVIGSDALEAMTELVDASLVNVTGSLSSRYRMLEPIRQFANELLVQSGDDRSSQLAHASFFAQRAHQLNERLAASGWTVIGEADDDLPNIQAAIGWYISNGMWTEAAHVIGDVADIWLSGSRHAEARHWIDEYRRQAPTVDDPLSIRLLDDASYLFILQGELDEAEATRDRMQAAIDAVADPYVRARADLRRASVIWFRGRRAEAVDLIRRSLNTLYDESPDGSFPRSEDGLRAYLSLGKGLITLGRIDEANDVAREVVSRAPSGADVAAAVGSELRGRGLAWSGSPGEAIPLLSAAVESFDALSMEHNAAAARVALARAKIDAGDLTSARGDLSAAAEVDTKLGDKLNLSRCLRAQAAAHLREGNATESAQRLVECSGLIELNSYPIEAFRFGLAAAEAILPQVPDVAAATLLWAVTLADEIEVPLSIPERTAVDRIRAVAPEDSWEVGGDAAASAFDDPLRHAIETLNGVLR